MIGAREFAIFFGCILMVAVVLCAIEKVEGFETMVFVGILTILGAVIGLALHVEMLLKKRK